MSLLLMNFLKSFDERIFRFFFAVNQRLGLRFDLFEIQIWSLGQGKHKLWSM